MAQIEPEVRIVVLNTNFGAFGAERKTYYIINATSKCFLNKEVIIR